MRQEQPDRLFEHEIRSKAAGKHKGTRGTVASEYIRDILLDNESNYNMTAETEALLYAAARSQVVSQVIKPALLQGKVVLADRFIDSTIAYQGYGRGLDLAYLEAMNNFAPEG